MWNEENFPEDQNQAWGEAFENLAGKGYFVLEKATTKGPWVGCEDCEGLT